MTTIEFTPAATESLAQALSRSREHLHRVQAPAHVQAAVLAASAHAMTQKRAALLAQGTKPIRLWMNLRQRIGQAMRGRIRSIGSIGKLGAGARLAGIGSMALAAGLVWLLAPGATLPTQTAASPALQFTALPGAQSVNINPNEPLYLVPVELPRAQLSRFGLPFDPALAAQPVRTEMLLNPQGQAVAVRFLP